MNAWKQTRLFQCPSCRAVYVHDLGYAHAVYACPARSLMPPVVMVAMKVGR